MGARGSGLALIVADASALADVLLRVPDSERVEERLLARGDALHAPHLIDLEILQVLRRFAARDAASARRAGEALSDFESLRIARHPHDAMRRRIWALRASMTAYDAAYVALAEVLDCPLVTRDTRLARAHGHTAVVEVV